MLLSYGADPNIHVCGELGTNAILRPPLAELLASNENTTVAELRLLLRYGAKVVMKTQFRDPAGLLNCLTNVAAETRLFEELINVAEEFDTSMIRRNIHLTVEQKQLLMDKASAPLSLKSQCRTLFRHLFGRTLSENVPSLFIPQMLKKYLLYEHS